jgi:uncharacterized protein YpiB (UPF0302 family)
MSSLQIDENFLDGEESNENTPMMLEHLMHQLHQKHLLKKMDTLNNNRSPMQ